MRSSVRFLKYNDDISAVSQQHVCISLLVTSEQDRIMQVTLCTLPLSAVKSSWNALIVTHSMTSPCIVTSALRILPTVTYTHTSQQTVTIATIIRKPCDDDCHMTRKSQRKCQKANWAAEHVALQCLCDSQCTVTTAITVIFPALVRCHSWLWTVSFAYYTASSNSRLTLWQFLYKAVAKFSVNVARA